MEFGSCPGMCRPVYGLLLGVNCPQEYVTFLGPELCPRFLVQGRTAERALGFMDLSDCMGSRLCVTDQGDTDCG